MEGAPPTASGLSAAPAKTYGFALGILSTLFFMWGFCTVLNDVLVPHLKAVFEMNYVQTMLIQFTFFGTYFLLSMPSAKLIEWVGYRHSIAIGLSVMALGCLIFLPAAAVPSFNLFLTALFVLAAGITLLQVAANPYVAVLGPERTASSRLNLAQGFNSLGTLLAPLFGSFLILGRTKAGTMTGHVIESLQDRMADARSVQMPYLGIAVVLLAIAVLFWVVRLPDVSTHPTTEAEAKDTLWRHKALVMGAVAIFVYVGAEVSIGSLLINYLASPHISHMTTADAANYLSYYWGGAMVGRFLIGALLLRFAAPSNILADNCVAAIILIVLSIATHGSLAMWAILLVGLCNSIMFPTIFTLSIRGLGPLTGRGSGVLIMAIFGGAVVPMLQAAAADSFGLTISFVIPIVCYAYIWMFARGAADKKKPAMQS
ncbi:MAG: sugar MFS transporter [Alphaproteobacteria bacterium]|nr:sugar MFS transporter [Alphaproteobacteria bacterium]MDE2163706.1 sugar MFS transporter [Alphaproteobacteria bacterium]